MPVTKREMDREDGEKQGIKRNSTEATTFS